jgi:hypothetical protein
MTDSLIKKFANKGKSAEYDPAAIVEALNALEPGWILEESVEAMPLRETSLKMDTSAIESAGFSGVAPRVWVYDTDISVSWRYNDPRTPEATKPSDSVVKGTIDEVLRQIASQVQIAKNPENPVEGQIYLDKMPKAKVEDEGNPFGEPWRTTSVTMKLTGMKRGMAVVNVISPSGLKISLLSKQTRSGVTYYDSPALWTSLYKTDIPEKAKSYLDRPEVQETEARRQLLKQIKDDAGNVGTCPVCDRMQKLSWSSKTAEGHPTMVLHGYVRPGYGYIQGSCFGVGYAPFELSNNGTVQWKARLEELQVKQRTTVARVNAMTETTIWIKRERNQPREQVTLYADGRVVPTGDTAMANELQDTPVHEAYEVEARPSDFFSRLKERAIRQETRLLEDIGTDIKIQSAKIEKWTLKPLPGTSAEDQQFASEQKSAECPGSGTTNHDNKHVGNYMSKWAHCNVCGQGISVTSTGKLRAHPFVKKATRASVVQALLAAADALEA